MFVGQVLLNLLCKKKELEGAYFQNDICIIIICLNAVKFQIVITWLERGDCNKRNANNFYSMIQSTNSHVRRLLNEKTQYEEELQKAKELMKGRMQGILLQCKCHLFFFVSYRDSTVSSISGRLPLAVPALGIHYFFKHI